MYRSCMQILWQSLQFLRSLASMSVLHSWAARCNTWLLIRLMPKGVVFSFLSAALRESRDSHLRQAAKHLLLELQQQLILSIVAQGGQ